MQIFAEICELADEIVKDEMDRLCVPEDVQERFFATVTVSSYRPEVQAWISVVDADCPVGRGIKGFADGKDLVGVVLPELLEMVKYDDSVERQIRASVRAIVSKGLQNGFFERKAG
jgi:hypothetical protein